MLPRAIAQLVEFERVVVPAADRVRGAQLAGDTAGVAAAVDQLGAGL